MSVKETLKAAIRSLLLNKVRSFLTMLGVIIGVFAVISLVSLVGGMKNYIEDQFEGLGSNLLFVIGGKVNTSQGQGFNTAMMNSSLKEKHVDIIKTFRGVDDICKQGDPGVWSVLDKISGWLTEQLDVLRGGSCRMF